jgi:hypothetical protein
MAKPAAAQVKSNEPGQPALDAVNLVRIRNAKKIHDDAVKDNNSQKNKLRTVYASTALQNLDNEAAGIALKLVEEGDEAIEKYCKTVRNVGIYVGYLGKVLSPAQYDLFGMAGTGPLPEDERAKIEGRAAGFKLDVEPGSKDSDNPYEIGSIKGQAWLSAFNNSRSERDIILSMPAPTPDASQKDGDAQGGGASGDAED